MKLINSILYKEIRPYLPRLVFILFLVLLGVAFETLTPWPFKLLIDNVLGSGAAEAEGVSGWIAGLFSSREALGFFAVVLFFLSSTLSTFMDYLKGVAVKKVNRQIIRNFAQKAFDNLEHLSIGFYRKQQIGDYVYRLSYDVAALGEFLERGVLPLVSHSLYLLFTIAILFLIHVRLATLSLLMLPFLVGALYIYNRQIGVASERSETSNSALFSFIEEVLTQLKIIQAFNQERRESQTFKEREEQSLTEELNLTGWSMIQNLLIGIVIALGYGVVIILGIQLVFFGELSTGLLIIFIFYLDNLTNPLLSLLSAASSLRENYVKVSRMNDFFVKKFQAVSAGTLTLPRNSEIVFDEVTVKEEGGGIILKRASFTIPPGKRTVIVGVSGSGKTTVASLILRFIWPASGRIFIGGKPINEYSLPKLRDAIAYVPQEVVLFNDTIRQNIAFGNPQASVRDISRAARLAVADGFIRRLPGKYDFWVGEEGSRLSGGQRQRLMIARAFARERARILILDEPLSSLDVKTRATLMDNLNRFAFGKTTIIISNVLEIIKQADYIIVLNQGELISAGKSGARGFEESRLADLIFNSG